MASETEQIVIETLIPYAIGGVFLLVGLGYLGKKFGAGAPDPGGGRPSTGLLDGLLNNTLEIGKSPVTYTDALTNTILHPITTAEVILGMSPSDSAPVGASANNGAGTATSASPKQLQSGDSLDSGQYYTFSFSFFGVPFSVSAADVQSAANSLDGVDNVSVNWPTTSGTFDVTFQWNGAGVFMDYIVGGIPHKLSAGTFAGYIGNFTFVQAVVGQTGYNDGKNQIPISYSWTPGYF